MSVLARTGLNASRRVAVAAARQQVRFAGNANVVHHTVPTNVTNKPLLAFKIATFAVLGFGTPFYAVYYHLNK